MAKLTPVDHDPFAQASAQPKLTAVDYDPFAEADYDPDAIERETAARVAAAPLPTSTEAPIEADRSIGETILSALLNPLGTLQRATAPVVEGIIGARGEALQRGGAGAINTVVGTGAEMVDAASPGRILAALYDAGGREDVADAVRDPMGAAAAVQQSRAITQQIGADRKATEAPRPSMADFIANPGEATGRMAQRVTEQALESTPQMAAGVGMGVLTRSPNVATNILGAMSGLDTRQRLITQGVDPNEATRAGALAALTERAGESVGMARILAPRGAASVPGAALANAAQEAPVSIAQTNITDQASGQQTSVADQILGALEAAGSGGLLGGGSRAVAAPFMPAADRSAAPTETAPPAPASNPRQAGPESVVQTTPEGTPVSEPAPVQAAPAPVKDPRWMPKRFVLEEERPVDESPRPVAPAPVEPSKPVEPVRDPETPPPDRLAPEPGTVERIARTGKGEFRLVDAPAAPGREFSEFGNVRIVEAFDGDTKIGELLYADDGTPPTINVEPSHQRRGVATAMLKLAEEQGGKLGDARTGISGNGRPGYRTDEGQAFREAADTSRVTLSPVSAPEAPAPPAAADAAPVPAEAAAPSRPDSAPASPTAAAETAPAAREAETPQNTDASQAPVETTPDAAPETGEGGVTADPEDTTTLKNADRNADRVRRGLAELTSGERVPNQAVVDEALDATEADPALAAETVARIRAGGDVSLKDEGVLLVEDVRQRQRRDAAAERLGNPDLDDAAREAAQREYDDAEARINELDEAARAIGSESGRLLQFRRRLIAQDFSLVAMERRERASRGRALTQAEATEVKAQADKIAELQRQLDEATSARAEAESRASLDAVMADLTQEATRTRRARASTTRSRPAAAKVVEKLTPAYEAARARVLASSGVKSNNKQSGALDIGLLADYATIGAYHLANGAAKFTDWAQRMIDDVGDAFKALKAGEKREVFKAAREQLDAEATAEPQTPADLLEGVTAEQVDGKLVRELALAHIQSGVRGEGPIMAAVAADVAKVAPDLDERDVRRLLSDYGKATFPSQDEDRKLLRELRALVQLQESIDRLLEGEQPLRSGPQRDPASDAVRAKRKELNDMLRASGRRHASSPRTLATINDARATNLRNQIKDLEARLQGAPKPQRTPPPPTTPEVDALRAERDRLKAELAEVEAASKPRPTPEQAYNTRRGNALQRELADVTERLRKGDYTRRTRPLPPALNAQNRDLAYKLHEAKRQWAIRQFEIEMQQRSPMKKILGTTAEGFNFARAIMTSLDMSALLRQGGFIAFGHPIMAARAAKDMVAAAASAKRAHEIERSIMTRPNAELYRRAKLELTDSQAYTPHAAEEAFMSRWLQKVPRALGGGLLRGSQRAFVTALNRLRADSFDAMVAAFARNGQVPTQAEIEAIADYVNVATGRGRIGFDRKRQMTGLNNVFFAPRLVASRFNLLAGQPLYHGSAKTRLLIAEEYARFLTGMLVVYGLAALASDDEEPIEADPRSANFLKIKVGDNTYLDPLTGLAQVTVFTTRALTGETKTGKGAVRPIRPQGPRLNNELAEIRGMAEAVGAAGLVDGLPARKQFKPVDFGYDSGGDVLWRFARTKLAPVPGAIVNTIDGEDVIGNPVTATGQAATLVTPLSLRDVGKIMQDNGVPTGSVVMALNLLGVGVQYRDPEKEFDKLKDYGSDDPRQ